LPLFSDDAALGIALLGVRRAEEWSSIVPIYERRGFPRIDPVMGGRYVPAIRAFFDREYGLTAVGPSVPDGVERPDKWKGQKLRA
jgi:hypothetical protein